MKYLASVELRIFLVCWTVFSLFFATNVVREHYPAFALIDRGDWVCDRYYEMHADLFRHSDGHVYTGNNVLGSLIAVPPLLLFDPLLDALEEHSRARLAGGDEPPDTTYDTKYPLRRAMFRRVKLAGLDLRFGASTAITSVFLMAPLSAGLVVLMYSLLRRRGVSAGRGAWLAFLFAFATPVLYRTAHLNHNVFLMQAVFAAFVLLWVRPGEREPLSLLRRVLAGFLCGCAFALDYAGIVPAAALTGYLIFSRRRSASWGRTLRESVPFLLAAVPPVLFLLGTQWAMYGNAFTPGQFVMNEVNFTEKGVKGIGLPSLEVFFKNLFSPSWGLVPFAPLLLLAFLPAWRYRDEELVLPRHERRWSAVVVLSFLLFCAANWYSLMQFNTGFRYLLPVVPFLFLAASDHLVRMPRRWLVPITALTVFHGFVLAMMREVNDTEKNLYDRAQELGLAQRQVEGYWQAVLTQTAVPHSYTRLLTEGFQLPWLTVLRQTQPAHAQLLGNPLLPIGLMGLTGALVLGIWRLGERREKYERETLPSSAG